MNRVDVQRILVDVDKYAKKVQSLLINNEYKPKYSPLRQVNEGTHYKKRSVCEPRYFPDQIIHWAIYQVIFDKLSNSIPLTSCGSITGRGQVYAKNKTEKWFRKDSHQKDHKMKYCLKFDISKCYDNINHNILFKLFKRKYKDEKFLNLIHIIIFSYHSNVSSHNGLPIGWVTSQLFSMFYLTILDNYLRHGNRYDKDSSVSLKELRKYISHIIRYMDDSCIYSNNKKKLRSLFKKLKIFLKKYMDIEIKDDWQIFEVYHYNKKRNKFVGRKIDFVGFTMGYCATGIRKSISKRILRCTNKIKNGLLSLHNCMSYLSYYGWIKHSRAKAFEKKYREGINRHLVIAIVRQGTKRILNKINIGLCYFMKPGGKRPTKSELRDLMFKRLLHVALSY